MERSLIIIMCILQLLQIYLYIYSMMWYVKLYSLIINVEWYCKNYVVRDLELCKNFCWHNLQKNREIYVHIITYIYSL